MLEAIKQIDETHEFVCQNIVRASEIGIFGQPIKNQAKLSDLNQNSVNHLTKISQV